MKIFQLRARPKIKWHFRILFLGEPLLDRAHPKRLFNPFRVGAVMGYRTQGDYPGLGYATPVGYLGKFTLKGLNNLAQGNHPGFGN